MHIIHPQPRIKWPTPIHLALGKTPNRHPRHVLLCEYSLLRAASRRRKASPQLPVAVSDPIARKSSRVAGSNLFGRRSKASRGQTYRANQRSTVRP